MSPMCSIYRGMPLDELGEVSWPIDGCHVGVYDWRGCKSRAGFYRGAGGGNLRSGLCRKLAGKTVLAVRVVTGNAVVCLKV
ncbi:hypothetical protein Tco_0196521 [Tanacetum coccineum]